MNFRRSFFPALFASSLFATLLFQADARADKVDELSQALLTDASFRVKVQAAIVLGKLRDPRGRGALVEALKDDNEAVRVVAASSLGKLADRGALDPLKASLEDPSTAVRGAAQKAIALIEKGSGAVESPGSKNGKIYVDLMALNPGQAGEASVHRVHEKMAAKLGELTHLTLDGQAASRARFIVDGNITNLVTTAPDSAGKVRTDCDLRIVVSTEPERSIKMMATVGGSVDGSSDPKDIADSRAFCLDDAAEQAVAKVQTFLETQ